MAEAGPDSHNIKDGGFDHVRMDLQAVAHMDKDGQRSATWLKTLDTLVDAGLETGLQAILDEHDFASCARQADLHDRTLKRMSGTFVEFDAART